VNDDDSPNRDDVGDEARVAGGARPRRATPTGLDDEAPASKRLGLVAPRLEDLVAAAQLRELAESAGRLFGVTVSVTNELGGLVAGAAPHALRGAVTAAAPPAAVKTEEGETYWVATIHLDGRPLGKLLLGPLDVSTARAKAVADHLLVSLGLILHAGERVLYSSTMHVASAARSYQELERKNRDLEEAYAKLKDLDQLKSGFLATVSHELRTPLTSIIGYSEMLSEGFAGPLTKDQLDFVQTIRTKGDQLLSLIMSLLDLTKLESGTLSMRPILLPIEAILGDAMSTALPKASKKGVKLRIERAPVSPSVRADPDRIRQVFVNLVDNAVKFTPQGGEIVLSAREVDGVVAGESGLVLMAPVKREVEVRIADQGIGIPPHERQRIFDPFYQVDQSSTRERGGAGLGLSIVKRIVEAHHGRIAVEENTPNGTVFVVHLPASERPRPSSSGFRTPSPPR
jgi:signal transduction histidine kinase